MSVSKEVMEMQVELTNLVRAKFNEPYLDTESRNMIDSNIMEIYERIKVTQYEELDVE